MFKFVVYERSESGQLERSGRRVNLSVDDIWARYPHREAGLKGWAEKVVYWNKLTGPAVGFAPITSAAEKAIAHHNA